MAPNPDVERATYDSGIPGYFLAIMNEGWGTAVNGETPHEEYGRESM